MTSGARLRIIAVWGTGLNLEAIKALLTAALREVA